MCIVDLNGDGQSDYLVQYSGTWTTYVFDGTEYRLTEQRSLERRAVDSLFALLQPIPIWQPPE